MTCKTTALMTALVIGFTTTGHAAVNVVEEFTYPNGSLDGSNGGTGFTSAWSASNFTIVSNQLSSNPNAPIQNSTSIRTFAGFTDTSFDINIDIAEVVDNEGSFTFALTLFDSNSLEVLSVGVRNDSYQVRLGSGATFQLAQGVAGGFANDTLSLSFDYSGVNESLTSDSTLFATLDGTLNGDIGSVDFSTGGTWEISKTDLDNNDIRIDRFEMIPEPSSALLASLSGLLLLRRRRC